MRRPAPIPAERLRAFDAYAAAGHEARSGVLLDANESAWGPAVPEAEPGLHRYPDATYRDLRDAAAAFAGVDAARVVTGNGSDELLDLALRAFADPGDRVAIAEPTYGMYRTCASLNGLEIVAGRLDPPGFGLDADAFLEAARGARVAALCSPNNPTGNRLEDRAIRAVLEGFEGLVVLDEAYVEFAAEDEDPNGASLAGWTEDYGNLLVLRTMSKAWGLAGARVGWGIGDPEVVALLDRIRPPYNVGVPAERAARRALAEPARLAARLAEVRDERDRLAGGLRALGLEPLPSDANFLLVPVDDAPALVARLRERGIRIRDRSGLPGLPSAVRITVGRGTENALALDGLAEALGRAPTRPQAGTNDRESPPEDTGDDRPAGAPDARPRRATVRRATRETSIAVGVDLDLPGEVDVATGIGFFDHMLTALLSHAAVSATVAAVGDLDVDPHHTVEDAGLALGEALDAALGDRAGIARYGFLLPMDESLAEAALDLSGRPLFVFEGTFSDGRVGAMPTALVPEFFRALATTLGATLHLTLKRGGDAHHEVEACFKAVGRALGAAVRRDPATGGAVPSTKGAL